MQIQGRIQQERHSHQEKLAKRIKIDGDIKTMLVLSVTRSHQG